MKKLFIFALVAMLATVSTLALAACGKDEITDSPFVVSISINNSVATVKVYREGDGSVASDFNLNVTEGYVYDILSKINDSDKTPKLTFNMSGSGSSAFINTISFDQKTYGNADENKYPMMYISTSDIAYADFTFDGFSFKDKTYNSAAIGVSEMPIMDAVTYIFTIISF